MTTKYDFIPHDNESDEEAADDISADETAPASSTCNMTRTPKTGVEEVSKSTQGCNHKKKGGESQTHLRRCAHCSGKALFSCSKCDVGLHPKCHKDCHTQQWIEKECKTKSI